MTSMLTLRIVLVQPPTGVAFCLQQGQAGKAMRVDQQLSAGSDLSFSLQVEGRIKEGGAISFYGPFTQGPAEQRFIYLCCGKLAGQAGSPWERRVKIHLSSITSQQIEEALRRPASVLEARYQATARDGGPACASVPLLDGGWRLVLPEKTDVLHTSGS